jgi:hypothetical protein
VFVEGLKSALMPLPFSSGGNLRAGF